MKIDQKEVRKIGAALNQLNVQREALERRLANPETASENKRARLHGLNEKFNDLVLQAEKLRLDWRAAMDLAARKTKGYRREQANKLEGNSKTRGGGVGYYPKGERRKIWK